MGRIFLVISLALGFSVPVSAMEGKSNSVILDDLNLQNNQLLNNEQLDDIYGQAMSNEIFMRTISSEGTIKAFINSNGKSAKGFYGKQYGGLITSNHGPIIRMPDIMRGNR